MTYNPGSGSGVSLGETDTTAYRGDRGKTAYDHTALTNNPHAVTKAQVGLANADNTSDAGKPVSSATQTALDGKQPLATVLTNTTAAFTTAQESKLSGIATGATANATDAALRDRSTHTGTQAVGTITGLGTLATQNGTFSGTSSGTNTGDQTSVSGNAGTATTLQTGRTIAITGDLTYTSPSFNGSGNVTAAGTLATVNSNVGTFGSSTLVPVVTVNAKGLVTAVSTAAVSGGGGSNVVYVAPTADTAINSTTDVTVVTRDVTLVSNGDQLVVETHFTILNNSTATRVYVITLDFDGLFDVEFSTAALATSATLIHPFYLRACLDVRSGSLSYGVFTTEGQLAAGIAAGGDTTMAATHVRGMSWGTTGSDASGTCTVALKVRSANATATQTFRLHQFRITKDTPTV